MLHGGVKKGRTGSKHDKTGCLTCRHRRKKCVENTLPTCGACIRLNLVCVREPPRRIVTPSKGSQAAARNNKSEGNPPQLHTETTLRTVDHSVSTRNSESHLRCHAMSYYIKVLSELLTVSKENNSFITDFIPLAMESPALYEALLSYASGHLSPVDSSYSIVALKARSQALNHLSKALNSSSWDSLHPESTLAASLILLTSEVCLGSHKSWYNHLIGAKNLILSSQSSTASHRESSGPFHVFSNLKSTSEGRWILRNFAYHDIISSVTLGRGPLLSGKYLEGITDVVDTYLGVASGILMSISDISTLDICPKTESGIILFHHRCLEIEQSLQSWQCPVAAPGPLSAAASAYRSAALIYLYRQQRRVSKHYQGYCNQAHLPHTSLYCSQRYIQGKLYNEVQNTLVHISNVPVGDISESCLLFPLFLAGGEATDVNQIKSIHQRLHEMLSKRQFQNINRALDILETLWERRRNDAQQEGYQSPDWADILHDQEEPLLLT